MREEILELEMERLGIRKPEWFECDRSLKESLRDFHASYPHDTSFILGELLQKDLSLQTLTNSSKSLRSATGAHYTPPEIVEELVRPALGHLFKQSWEASSHDPLSYSKKLKSLKILDPAMGAGYLLAPVALEIARELAWVEIYKEPRPFEWHEPMLHINPIGENPEWFDPEKREDDSDFALPQEPLYQGPENFEPLVGKYLPEVMQSCIYGVDINPEACEVARMYLWLFLMKHQQEEEPLLDFMGENLKCGNTLVGITLDDAWEEVYKRFGIDEDAGILELFEEVLKKEDVRSAPKEEVRWIYDLGVLARLYSVKPGKYKKLEDVLLIEGVDWERVLRDPLDTDDGEILSWREAIVLYAQQIPMKATTTRPMHWELEFPEIFLTPKKGFDGIVANPPFVGDKKLQGFAGSTMVKYYKNTFSGGAVTDLCGFFFLQFNNLINGSGIISTLGSNTMAQAKNRRRALIPLTQGENPLFRTIRSRQSEQWPGDASVFVCMLLCVRLHLSERRYHRWVGKRLLENAMTLPISSYLDTYPESDFSDLPSMKDGLVYTGHFLRGDFFLRHSASDLNAAIEEVPEGERSSLYAYLNNQEVQSQVRPIPSRIAIDFFDDLVSVGLDSYEDGASFPSGAQLEWLKENRPYLLQQLETIDPDSPTGILPLRQTRERLSPSTDNDPHIEFWWRFGRPRVELRSRWQNSDNVIAFGRVSKIWSPLYLSKIEESTELPICPSDQLFISPTQNRAFFGILSSFLFEAHMRREASTIKTDLRVTPTDSLPVFPLPWRAAWNETEGRPFITNVPERMENTIGELVDGLLRYRQEILDEPDEYDIPTNKRTSRWGPTELYNLYDDPDISIPSIVRLRELHEELLTVVIEQYGWTEHLPSIQWCFDRPWIDRTTRYVPNLTARRTLFSLLAELNAQRYQEEILLYLEYIRKEVSPGKKYSFNALQKLIKNAGIQIQKGDLEEVLRIGFLKDPSGKFSLHEHR